MDSWRHAAAALVADLRRVFAGRLRSLVAYGPRVEGEGDAPLTCLALVDSLGISDLDACAEARPVNGSATEWRFRSSSPTRSFADRSTRFRSSTQKSCGRTSASSAPIRSRAMTISREDLRRACETQVKSHLLHLREGFIETGGRPQAIADLVCASAPAFAALLRNVARLNGGASPARADATREGARSAGLADGIVADVLALDRPSTIPTTDAARLFPQYLAAVEQLARAVDSWRA